MTGILHVYGEVDVQTISLLRSIASQYSTLKILFSCNEKVILNEITTYMNCVKLADDDKYNLLTAMAPCFNERLFGVVDKHFKIIYPILHDSLEELQERVTELKNGCRVVPSERSFAIAVGTSLGRDHKLEQLGNWKKILEFRNIQENLQKQFS